MGKSSGSLRLRLAVLLGLLGLGIFSVASFAASSGTGSISVSAGGTSGSLGTVTGVSGNETLAYVSSTTVNGTATTTSIPLASVSGIRVGDSVKIGSSTQVVTGIGGSTLTTTAFGSAPSNGATVYKVLKYGTATTWTPVLNSPGSITAGDVYLVDVADYSGNVLVSLYVTNPDQLGRDYSYLNQQVNVYALCAASSGCTKGTAPFAGSGTATQGAWVQATDAAGNNVATTGLATNPMFLTLTSGYVTFIVKGGYQYTVAVDGGSSYTIATTTTCTTGTGCLSPSYFLDLNPA